MHFNNVENSMFAPMIATLPFPTMLNRWIWQCSDNMGIPIICAQYEIFQQQILALSTLKLSILMLSVSAIETSNSTERFL